MAGKDLPRRWQDIADLPFATKAMLRESQERHSPSAIIWQRRKRLCGVQRTSGTTGRPMNAALSEHACAIYAGVGGRAVVPSDSADHCLVRSEGKTRRVIGE